MLSGLQQELKVMRQELRGSINEAFGRKKKSIEVTDTSVLGYSLYPAQVNMLDFCFKNTQINYKDRSKVNVFMLMGARDYGKTNTVSILGIPQRLALHPQETFIISTRLEGRAKQVLTAISFAMKKLGFKGKFSKQAIRLQGNISKEDSITICNSSPAGIRGRHVDWIILDDLVISSDEKSEVERENAKDFFREALNAGRNIIILGQPVHEKDLYAMLEEIESETSTLKNKMSLNILRVPHGSIPELDKDLDVLRLMSTEREIQKNYMLRLVKDELYPFRDISVSEFKFASYTTAVIDPAYGGEDFVGVAIGIRKEDKYYCLVKQFGHDATERRAQEDIIKYLRKNNVVKCYIETKDVSLRNSFKQMEDTILWKYWNETRNKETKIAVHIGINRDNIVLSSYGDYLKVSEYTFKDKHDDIPDALASLLNFISGNKDKVKVR